MPHFSFSNNKTNDFSSLLFHFCFSIFSHPLYFSYFIFFSPYILKLISFLSPLFITTTLLLLTLFSVSSSNFFVLDTNDSEFPDSKLGFLLSNFQTLIQWLQSKSNQKDEESGCLEEFEAYLVMFQASIFQALEAKPEENCSPCFEANQTENNVSVAEVKSLESLFQETEEFKDLSPQMEEKGNSETKVLENLFKEDEGFEDLVPQKEAKLVEPELSKSEEETKAKLVEPELSKSEEETKGKMGLQRSGFKVMESDAKLDGEGEKKVLERMLQKEDNEERKGKLGLRSGFKVMNKSQRLLEASLGSPENNWVYTESNHLGSFGSMRKEKEWRRTLACKLFEERHNNSNSNINNNNNVNGNESEGMDSLWETYETESIGSNKNNTKKKVLEKSKTKKSETKYYDPEDEEDDEEEEEEEEGMDGKLCCLQALKFSAGKMNLGMGKPNLMKISKAFKGIGWLHHHVGRHGRKG